MPPDSGADSSVPQPDLLARARGGDRDAFADLSIGLRPGLVAYARAICGNRQTAEDAVQESLIAAMDRVHSMPADAEFGAWIRAFVRRQSLAARRRSGRHAGLGEALLAEVEAVLAADDGETDRERRALRRCRSELPEAMAQAVSAFYDAGLPIAHIATTLGITAATVRTRLHRARAALRECVRRRLLEMA
jgi:RNA polymerase sigma-70 factor (ECF subfamily)